MSGVYLAGKPVLRSNDASTPEETMDKYLSWFGDNDRPIRLNPVEAQITIGPYAGKVVVAK